LFSFNYVINNYEEIERAIGTVSLEGNENVEEHEGVNELTGTNMIAILQQMINTVINENIELNKRVTSMEAKVLAIYAHFSKSPERSRFDFPNENRVRKRYATEGMGRDIQNLHLTSDLRKGEAVDDSPCRPRFPNVSVTRIR
jgi:hypothetical protein